MSKTDQTTPKLYPTTYPRRPLPQPIRLKRRPKDAVDFKRWFIATALENDVPVSIYYEDPDDD